MPSEKSDILFYSNHCQFSKQVIDLCVSHNIRDYFVLICIDHNRDKLPYFVDRVPLIYRKSHSDVIHDEAIVEYISSIVQATQKEQQPAATAPSVPTEIQPFSLHQNVNYSDHFSFLNDQEIVNDPNKRPFTMLGEDMRFPSVQQSDDNGGKVKLDTKILDQYMQARDQDTASFKSHLNNGLQPIVR
jgi:hypothetical protein